MWALYLLAAVALALVVVWLVHLVSPGWLAPDQVRKLEDLVTGGVLTTALAEQLRRRLR